MKNLIAIYALLGSTVFSLAQTVTEPHGEGSVVFESPGGKWQKAVITDQLTGESSAAYSLDAETSATDIGNESALPSPYAKNSFAAENTTSSSRIPSTPCANSSAVRIMLVCRCTVPFGFPVEPEE